jgi:hypothetical protein
MNKINNINNDNFFSKGNLLLLLLLYATIVHCTKSTNKVNKLAQEQNNLRLDIQ